MEKAMYFAKGVNKTKRRKGFENKSDKPAFHPNTIAPLP